MVLIEILVIVRAFSLRKQFEQQASLNMKAHYDNSLPHTSVPFERQDVVEKSHSHSPFFKPEAVQCLRRFA